MATKIVVIVEGGNVQNVFCDDMNATYCVVDHDNAKCGDDLVSGYSSASWLYRMDDEIKTQLPWED
jgi:hypothetical protein